MWNEHLHRRDNHVCDALGTQRGGPDPETVIIPREIGKSTASCLPTEKNHDAKRTASSVCPEVVQER